MLPLTTAQEPGYSAPPSCSSCRAQQWLNRSFCQGSYRAAGNEMYLPSFSWKKAEPHWLWCPTEAHCQEGFSQEHSPNTQSLQPNKAGYRPPGLFYSRKGTSLTPEKLLELLGNKTGNRPRQLTCYTTCPGWSSFNRIDRIQPWISYHPNSARH